jgi:beta-lactamase class A
MKKHLYAIVVVSILIGGILGVMLGSFVPKTTPIQPPIQPSLSSQFPLLSKRIAIYDDTDRLIHFVPLRRDLRSFIATQSSTFAVYFEYIPTGNNIGVNDTQPFAYASLLKVPLVLTVYKKIEQGTTKLTDKLTITEKTIDKRFGTLWQKGIGTNISVAEAIKLTLTESDNTAYQLLRTLVTAEEFAAIFKNLDIPLSIEKGEPVVTAKNFTSILRSLFFSSTLTEESSQAIFQLLTQSTFVSGIRKPIPANIPVAHKMGIRQETDSLSDCGVVYLPNRPYFLCAVSINDTSPQAEATIQAISKKVYDYVNN